VYNLDPTTITDMMPAIMCHQLRNCLSEVDHDNNLVPELAESWGSTPDARTWTFKLKKGIEFHNGKTMDAQDVIFSINYHRGKDSKSPVKSLVDPIKEIKANGKYTVVFTLAGGNADFPYIMSDFHLKIVPDGTTDYSKGIGTGPFILVDHEPGVRMLAKRNPNYFKEGLPYFNEVETLGINDVVARTNALRTGGIDIMNRPDRKTLHLLKNISGIQIMETFGTKHYTFPMLTDRNPYDNNNVRLALKYAIDREQILKNILHGYGTLGNDHPIGRANRYHADELPQREYDPEKAKFYFKKSGLTDHTFKLHTANAAFEGAVDTAILYSEHASKAGIKIQVVREPDDGFWSDVWMKKDWAQSFWFGRPTEDWMFTQVYSDGASWNESHFKHDRFNKLLIEARSELDHTKRREMYVEMQRIVSDEGGSVIPVFPSDLLAAKTKLKFKRVAANIEFDGLKAPERMWFES